MTTKPAAKKTKATKPAKTARAKAAQAEAAPAAKAKLSALDAAAKVLGESGTPMTTRQMIETMATKGYWTSPNGQTPAALTRQIMAKGTDARFKKTERGKFAVNGAA
jgi:hypothetical protein